MKTDRQSTRKKQSLETMDDYEQHDAPNTPRSLEACYREGVSPCELLYRAPEQFRESGLSPRIQQLNFTLYETKRRESLALVRKARDRIKDALERSGGKSASESRASTCTNFYGQIERMKEKKLKAIRQLVTYESEVTDKLLRKQEKERKKIQVEAARRKVALQLEKEKHAQRCQEEEKQTIELQRKEKSARRKAAKELRKQSKEAERRQKREAQEVKERIQMMQQSESRMRLKLERANAISLRDKQTLEEKLQQEQLIAMERKKAIRRQQAELQAKLRTHSREIELKRQRAAVEFEKEMEAKREKFYAKKSQESRLSARFKREQELAISRLKQSSTERDQKAEQIISRAAQLAEEKRQSLLKKLEQNERTVQKQREIQSQHREFRRHITVLKDLKKEWNLRRKKRREEYLKAVSEEKLRLEDAKVRQFLSEKHGMVRSCTELNRILDFQQHRLKEAVHTMAITKKWSPLAIERLAGGSVDIPNSARSTARGRPKTAGV